MIEHLPTAGRTSNLLFIYFATRHLSNKHDLFCKNSIPNIEGFDIDSAKGTQVLENMVDIHDDIENVPGVSFSKYFWGDKKNDGLRLTGYFQTPSIFADREVVNSYRGGMRPQKTMECSDVFVHVRAGDISYDSAMLPFDYYDRILSRLTFSNGFVSSDSPHHPTVVALCRKYSLTPYYETYGKTLLRAICSNRLVLSGGSYSLLMGLLTKAKTIHCITNRRVSEIGCRVWHPNYCEELVKNEGWIDYDV